jgi:L-asparaginase II
VPAAPLATITRNGLLESAHLGHVAVCDARGRLVAWAGDPTTRVYVRSCMKPVQAAVSLAAMDAVSLTEREVAVMCASHNGEQVHLRAVRSLLRRCGLTEAHLRTPADRPLDPEAAVGVRTPAPVFHNCSGKHAGMLLAASTRGWRTDTYRSAGHPLQRRVVAAVRDLAGIDPVVGVDGCGVPVHGMPLRRVATMYARLSTIERLGELAPSAGRALDAMRAEPYLVGGRRRDDTAVMQAVPGLAMKEGAEALDCVVAPDAGLGIAVKVADGGYRAAGPATIAVLDQLGLIGPGARRDLARVARPPVLGGGRPQGHLEPVVRLRTRAPR